MRFLCQWLTSCPHLCVWKYAFSLSSKTHRGSIRVHTTVLMRSFVKRSKTIELHVCDVSWTLCSMHHLQTHAPEIFSIIVSIMMRFRPSILIRFVCVFVLIHFQERFQIDVLSVRTEGLNASKCTRFQTKTHHCEQGLRGCYIRLLVENVLACQRTLARINRLQATIISARQAVFPSAHVSKS